jgi:hypothetical protein
MTEVSSSLAPQLDYKKSEYMHPTYRYTKVLQQAGGQSATITTAGGQETIFELPIKCMNLNRSYLDFSVNLPAVADRFQSVYYACFPFWRQVQLYTRSGIYICDINEFANYTKVVWNPETKLSEFLNYQKTGVASNIAPAAVGATPAMVGLGCLYERSNGMAGAAPAAGVAGTNPPALAGAGVTGPGNVSTVNYTEPIYFKNTGAVNQQLVINVRLPLNMIYNSIFSVDKDLYFGEIILMRIVYHPTTKFSFLNTAANPIVPEIQTQNATLNNIALYLAVEKNEGIVNSLRSQILSSGLNVLIPYVYTFKNTLPAGQNISISQRFNRGHGRRLLKLYHSAFNSVESINTAFDHSNVIHYTAGGALDGGKILSYYTLLNNERLQEFDLDCRQLNDWEYHKEKLRDSVLQDSRVYSVNWFHCDDWTGIFDSKKKDEKDNLETGLTLDLEQRWDIYITSANPDPGAGPAYFPYNQYTFAITQKMLTISPQGITVL